MNLNLIRGLSLNLNGSLSWIRDQMFGSIFSQGVNARMKRERILIATGMSSCSAR